MGPDLIMGVVFGSEVLLPRGAASQLKGPLRLGEGPHAMQCFHPCHARHCPSMHLQYLDTLAWLTRGTSSSGFSSKLLSLLRSTALRPTKLMALLRRANGGG